VPRRAAAFLAALIGAGAILFGGPMTAANAAGEAIGGRVIDVDKKPVPGAEISIKSAGFSQTVTTDAKGSFNVPVPGAGNYTVKVTGGLPSGQHPDRSDLVVNVPAGQTSFVIIPLTTGTGSGTTSESKWSQAPQLFVDGLVLGLIIALAAVGLSLIYGTTGLTNFAHGELVTLGGLVTFFLNVRLGMPFILAGALGVLICGVLGGLQDALFWRRLRKRGTGLIAMLVISIGVSIFLRYFYLYLFGGANRPYAQYQGQAGIALGPVAVTPRALISSIVAIIVILLAAFWLLRTRMGKATRAVADNPALASASGIDVERVINVVWIFGAALAALSGVILGLTQQVSFQMGFQILLLVFAGVTLGGLGTAFGALVGSIVVGVLIQVSTLVVPPELKNLGALAILIIILLVRPQGILGRRERVG
jgi:neutral amino acid transport system permease protein